MKKFLATMLALVMALTLCATAWADEPASVFVNGVANVSNVTDLQKAIREANNASWSTVDLTINIVADTTEIDFSSWTEISTTITGNTGEYKKNITLNGNNHVLTGMKAPLFSRVAQNSITINDLTIKDAAISTVSGYNGAGAFACELVTTNATFEKL